ncbi:hypothetical protein JCM10908_002869 [Rhodotorula pacifica]|uniref:uncharacterized protein n=1 Tax=Rhodotorula pacifica TaxID=1495444 RepID=UPI00317B75C0
MLVWLLKLLLLSLNIRAAHKALAPVTSIRERSGRRSGSGRDASRSERARRRQIREEVINWTVLTLFVTAEKVADRTVGRVLPLYGTAKVVVLLLLLVLRGPGAQQIYEKLVVPLIRPYERPLDLAGFIVNEILDILLAAVLFLPKLAARKYKQRQATHDVPSILRGLREPHQPKLAASLADSIERSQDDTNAISARFSQPVHVGVQPIPFKPRRPVALSRPGAVTTAQATRAPPRSPPAAKQKPGLPPPPASSTAPFRPVPIIKTSYIPRAAAQSMRDPNAAPPPARVRSGSGPSGIPSIYPSLANVSAPLPTPHCAVHTARVDDAASDTHRPSPHSMTHNPAIHDRDSISSHDSSAEEPPVKRRRSVIEKPAQVPPESSKSIAAPSTQASPVSHSSSRPPPTPAPPGAFNFMSPPAPHVDTSQALSSITSLSGEDDVEMDVRRSTPRRRSARQSAATPRARADKVTPSPKHTSAARESGAETGAEQVTPPATRRKRSSVAADTTGATPEPASERAAQDLKSATGTPRQRALGAIAQLSKDLLSEDEDVIPALSLTGRKKASKGVLGRSTRGAEHAPTRRTVRSQARASLDDNDSQQGADNGSRSRKVSPQKRKARGEADSDAGETSGSDVRPAKRSATIMKRQTAVATTSSLAKPSSRSTSASIAPPPQADQPKAAKSNPPASKSRRITGEKANGDSAPRRPRRILLGRAGPGAAEEEEEIDGVPVVSRRRKQL